MQDCLFCKIIAGQIPSKKVYEDEKVFVFEDLKAQAPTHLLIVPKKHIPGLDKASAVDAELLGYCELTAARIAREREIEDGYRTVYNVGPRSGQSVFHLHLHLLGGRDLKWPPG
jgi:histidine triad (HIT) family protein